MGATTAVDTVFRGVDRISSVTAKITGGMDRMAKRTEFVSSRMNRAAGFMLGPLKSFMPLLSVVGIAEFANKAIAAFVESEGAIANVNAGLKSTKNAIGLTTDQIAGMANAWQKVGIFEDDAIMQNVSAQLLTFGNIGKQNFDRVQGAVMDVTAKLKGLNATGEDLRGVSIMFGKAMDDPIRGMAAMRRVGISFSNAEEQQVKQMVAANNVLGAQNFMLKAIERQYGGTSEALGKTAGGMALIKKHKFDDELENLGKSFLVVKRALMSAAAQIMPFVTAILPPLAKGLETVAPFLPYIAGGILACVVAMKAWRVAMIAFRAVTFTTQLISGMRTGFTMLESAQLAGAKNTERWAIAQKGLNATIGKFSPAKIIGGIGLIAAAFEIWTNRAELAQSATESIMEMFTDKETAAKYGKIVGESAGRAQLKDIFVPGLSAVTSAQESLKNKAPNAIDAKASAGNTTVNLYNANPGSKADISPKRNATVNMQLSGAN